MVPFANNSVLLRWSTCKHDGKFYCSRLEGQEIEMKRLVEIAFFFLVCVPIALGLYITVHLFYPVKSTP